MINTQYRLTSPMVIETNFENLDINSGQILVRPKALSICKADMRYYFGMRDAKVLKQRLPLALIHEACGTVLYDKNDVFRTGDKVILLPNIPGKGTQYSENYRLDSRFRSSRADGFMQEMLNLPASQIIQYQKIDDNLAAITEFISVGVHAVSTYQKQVKHQPKRIAVWGDGALGYAVSCLLKYFFPEAYLTCIGVNRSKLAMFRFADECLTADEVTSQNIFDDVFECVGGQASQKAISQIIDTILPEGIIMLLGVSEEPVPILTRMVLEKGLTLIGRSRSTREDFEQAVYILEHDKKMADRMKMLISEEVEVRDVDSIHQAFRQSKIVDFKLIMNWKI